MSTSLKTTDSTRVFKQFEQAATYTVVSLAASSSAKAVDALYASATSWGAVQLKHVVDTDQLRATLSADQPVLLHVEKGMTIDAATLAGLKTPPILLFVDCEDVGLAVALAQTSSPLVIYVAGEITAAEFQPFAEALLDAATGGATVQQIADYLAQVSPTISATLISAVPDEALSAPPEHEMASLIDDDSTDNVAELKDTRAAMEAEAIARAMEEAAAAEAAAAAAIERPRRLDAAMPDKAYINQTTEVRAMVAQGDSIGLKALLPAETVEGDLIEQDDVSSADVFVQFNDMGAVVWLNLMINSADFHIDNPTRKLPLRQGRDSSMVTFFLTPQREQKRGRVVVQLFADEGLTEPLGETVVYTEIVTERTEEDKPQWTLSLGGVQPNFQPNPLFAFANKISSHFKLNTLYMICRSFNIDPENIKHEIKFEFAFELAELFSKFNQLPQLIAQLRAFNPAQVDWEEGLDISPTA